MGREDKVSQTLVTGEPTSTVFWGDDKGSVVMIWDGMFVTYDEESHT